MNTIAIIAGLVLIAVVGFLAFPAASVARFIKRAGPYALIGIGGLLTLFGRGGIGIMMIMGGVALLRRFGGVGTFGPSSLPGSSGKSGAKKSSVRSAMFEMELDHQTGEMNGVILAGRQEGALLDDLEEDELLDLYSEIQADEESVALLEAYLDRRFPGWREDAELKSDAGHREPAGSGSMGEEEAYEILGIAPGASAAEIRTAHRRLMKGAHPDSGGSTFLAAKVNEAKDVLLKGHS